MAADTTTQAAYLKTLWPQKRVKNLIYPDHPFYAMVPKDETFVGANAVIATRYADSQGVSSTFATAQANKGNNAAKKFTVTRVPKYGLATVTNEALLASENDKGALVRILDTEISSVMNAVGASIAADLYGSGTGSLGVIAVQATSPITLATISDIAKFEVGMKLTASATDGGTVLDSGAALTVTGVDRDLGTFTFTGTISGLSVGYYLQRQGDLNATVSGLAAWVPSSAPSATLFFGVDRTADVTRLGGVRIDVSTMNPEEGLVDAIVRMGFHGANPSHFFCSWTDYGNIIKALGAKLERTTVKSFDADVGFDGVKIYGGKRPVVVVPDQDCKAGKGYLTQLDTWKLMSLGPAVRVLDTDGNKLLREGSSDGVEYRCGGYLQLTCDGPGLNAVVTLPS